MTLLGETMEVLRQATTFALRRHDLLAQNVANADTPGFRARDLGFAHQLSIAQRTAALPAADLGTPALDVRVVDGPDAAVRDDGNTVDVDRQMARLSHNALYHNVVVQLMTARIRTLRSAITGQP
jgi:flagellar basal-body rod protein FlgB